MGSLTKYSPKNTKLINLVFIIIFLISIFSIDKGVFVNRILRLVPNIVALGIVLYNFKFNSNKYILGFLIFLLCSSIASIGYENILLKKIAITLGFIAYVALGFFVMFNIKKIKTTWFLNLYFIAVILLTIYLFNQLLSLSHDKLDNQIYILFMLNIIAYVFAIASAILYIHYSPNRKSMLFLLIVVFFILSEIVRFFLYYNSNQIIYLYYIYRTFYVFGLLFVVWFSGLKEEMNFFYEEEIDE